MSRRRWEVVWTSPARDALLEIVRTMSFLHRVETTVSRLGAFPLSGRILPEYPSSGLREVLVGDYRAIYRLVQARRRVEILSFLHGARDLRRIKARP